LYSRIKEIEVIMQLIELNFDKGLNNGFC
jgi:hypothetical protein